VRPRPRQENGDEHLHVKTPLWAVQIPAELDPSEIAAFAAEHDFEVIGLVHPRINDTYLFRHGEFTSLHFDEFE
jgi:hypothetical protein